MNDALYDYAIHDAQGHIVQTVRCLPSMKKDQWVPEGGGIVRARKGQNWDTHYVVDGRLFEKPAQPSASHVFDYSQAKWVDLRSLDDLKASKWQEIKEARDAHQVGGFEWEGNQFDSDPISQERITQQATSAMIAKTIGAEFNISWTLADKSSVQLNADSMLEVQQTMSAHIGKAHARGRQLWEEIQSAHSAEALNKITW